MSMTDITAVAGAIGPTAAILLYLFMQTRGREPANDPVKDLTNALGAIRERLVALETIVSRLEKRGEE